MTDDRTDPSAAEARTAHAGHAGKGEPPARAGTGTMVATALVLAGVLLILFLIGMVPRVRQTRALAAAAEGIRTAVPRVQVLRPEPASEASLTLAATTQAIEDAVIYARASGYLRRRHADIGDRVKAGQLLAEIESPEVDAQLRQAQANLRQAERNLELQRASRDLAKVTMDRYLAASAEKAVAVEAVDQSVSAHRTADAAVAASEATVEANRATVQQYTELASFARVVAPFSGTIIQRNVDVGALITAGSPTDNTAVAPTNLTGAPNGLFELARFDQIRVYVNVPQAFAPNVRTCMPVRVRVRGQLDEPIAATVSRTSSSLDPGTRTLLAQVDLPNRSGVLLPGMFVYVDLQIAPSGRRWRVPATAVVVDAKGTRVATVIGTVVRFQRVELGRDYGDAIEIQGGLQGQEMIVAQPTVALEDGQVVEPLPMPYAR